MGQPATQSVFDADGNRVFEGHWDPRAMADLLTEDPVWWRGRRVLDLGANTAGLSLELARMGAQVTAAEPDPYGHNITLTRDLVNELVKREGLKLELSDADLFSSHELARHEVILCLGLIYHFRHPQFIIDYLSSLRPEWLFLSCQTHPSKELAMFNRVGVVHRPGHLPPGEALTGWHPTRRLLERMLKSAGFTDITSLGEACDFPRKPVEGATNSAYYRARLTQPVDPEHLKRVFYGGGVTARSVAPKRADLIP